MYKFLWLYTKFIWLYSNFIWVFSKFNWVYNKFIWPFTIFFECISRLSKFLANLFEFVKILSQFVANLSDFVTNLSKFAGGASDAIFNIPQRMQLSNMYYECWDFRIRKLQYENRDPMDISLSQWTSAHTVVPKWTRVSLNVFYAVHNVGSQIRGT